MQDKHISVDANVVQEAALRCVASFGVAFLCFELPCMETKTMNHTLQRQTKHMNTKSQPRRCRKTANQTNGKNKASHAYQDRESRKQKREQSHRY